MTFLETVVLLVDIAAVYNELAYVFLECNNYFHLKTYFKDFIFILRSTWFSLPPTEKKPMLAMKKMQPANQTRWLWHGYCRLK